MTVYVTAKIELDPEDQHPCEECSGTGRVDGMPCGNPLCHRGTIRWQSARTSQKALASAQAEIRRRSGG